MEVCLRKLFCDAAQQCKNIDIFIADKDAAKLVETLGFHCRGKKIGSCKIGDDYYDEIGVDLSFFNIEDAKKLFTLYVSDTYTMAQLSSALTRCQTDIQVALAAKQIDQYAALYLENMAFQMVREGVGEKAIRRYGLADQAPQPWNALIQKLPGNLLESFIHLDNLTTKVYVPGPTQEFPSKRQFK